MSKPERNTGWWISSLALSLTFCAIMFVIFGGYLADLRKELAAQDARIEALTQQQNTLMSELDEMRHPAAEVAPVIPQDSVIPRSESSDPSTSTPAQPIIAPSPLPMPESPAKP